MIGLIYFGSFIAFLKMVSWGAGVTLGTKITIDIMTSEAYERWRKKVTSFKTVKGFQLNEGHTVGLGMTRHGKTWATMETFRAVKEGVIFFNVQQEETPKEFVKADMTVSISSIKEALKRKEKINYIPSTDLETMAKELAFLIRNFYDGEVYKMYFIVDECHLFKKESLAQLQRIATTGLRFGIKGVFLSQRGALIDNTLISQSTLFILFYNNQQDVSYWNNYGFPIEEMMNRINGEKYLFCTYDGKSIEGAFKIG